MPIRHKPNALQLAIIEQFVPCFAPGAEVLYLGSTAQKQRVCETESLTRLNIDISDRDKLPDVVLHDVKKNQLFLFQVAGLRGPIHAQRRAELEAITSNCVANRIYFSVFLTRAEFAESSTDIAWGTVVWCAAEPEHMGHYSERTFVESYGHEKKAADRSLAVGPTSP
jgi:hypothetical protein